MFYTKTLLKNTWVSIILTHPVVPYYWIRCLKQRYIRVVHCHSDISIIILLIYVDWSYTTNIFITGSLLILAEVNGIRNVGKYSIILPIYMHWLQCVAVLNIAYFANNFLVTPSVCLKMLDPVSIHRVNLYQRKNFLSLHAVYQF